MNTFGADHYRKESCDVVKLRLSNRHDEEIEICAVSFPVICTPLRNKIETASFPHLEGLQLADSFSESDGAQSEAIDVLIGSDYYWDIVSGEMIRGDCGLTAIDSNYGWLLSGLLHNSTNLTATVSNLIISGDVQQVEILQRETDDLTNTLKQFWETESIGICSSKEP